MAEEKNPDGLRAANIEEVFSRLAADKEKNQLPSRPPAQNCGDKESLKQFRETLLACDWAKNDVYRLSVKFFGKRSGGDLDAQHKKLLSSMHYGAAAEENDDLALKVLLDEMTSAEAIKKSRLRKNEAELRKTLAIFDWAAGNVDALAKKYAGEKTAEELAAKYSLLLSELPCDDDPQENRRFALRVLLDSSAYGAVREEAAKAKYSRQVSRLFKTIPPDYVQKATELFCGKLGAEELLNRCEDAAAEIRLGAHPKDVLIPLRILLGEISKEDALRETRRLKNADDIARTASGLSLAPETAAKLLEAYGGERLFDEEFLALFNSFPSYPGAGSANAVLAVNVLSGDLPREAAVSKSLELKNREAITTLVREIGLGGEYENRLLERYGAVGAPDFKEADFDRVAASLPQAQGTEKAVGLLAVKAILGDITEETAFKMAELERAFAEYSLPEETINLLAERFLGKKTAGELLQAFEGILDKLAYVESREENYGLAVEALLEGPSAVASAVDEAALKKDRALFQQALNGCGWFSGHVSDLTEKFFASRPASGIIADFDAALLRLPFDSQPTENYDLGIKILLGKMTAEEAAREADFRKALRSSDWGKDFAAEIAGAYLGARGVKETVDFLAGRFGSYGFWKGEAVKHRFAVELLIKELNGQLDEKASLLAFEVLNAGSPVALAREIAAAAQAARNKGFSPAELGRSYAAFAAEADHKKAAETIIGGLS